MSLEACLLFASCDAYSDLWPFTAAQLIAAWPDCTLKRYLLANERGNSYPGFETIRIAPDRGWSANLKSALDVISEPYVFLYIDDLFLLKRVDNSRVTLHLQWAIDSDADYLRLHPFPPMGRSATGVAWIPSATAYRTATVMSFWKRECLRDLLVSGESAWQFELDGTERSGAYERFYATTEQHFDYYNLVVKGKLRRAAKTVVAQHGYDPSRLTREVLSRHNDAIQTLKEWRARAFWALPPRYQKSARDLLMGRTYAKR